jgi:hypothetical protein
VQRAELRDDKKQEEHSEQAGVQKVLPSLPLPYAAQRKQVIRFGNWDFGCGI